MTRLLQDWATEQAQRRPGSPAIVSAEGGFTYAELDALSNQLARLLNEAGCRRFDRIALLMPTMPAAIVGLLGIYKADCIYVPIDTASPVSRIRKILESCENTFVLAAGPVAPLLRELLQDHGWRQRLQIGWLEYDAPEDIAVAFTWADVARSSASPWPARNGSGDPAHILFTSGSTGVPKGVVLTHASVVHFIEWVTRYFGMDAADRACMHPPLHFDMSMLDLFSMMAVGGQLHLVPRDLSPLPNALAEFIRRAELTQWYSVPPVLNYLAKFDAVRFDDFPAMKRVLWCGDVLPTPALIYWMQRLPHATFANLYGPTEAAISSSYYVVPECPRDPQAAIPIGTPCGGEELLVLDDSFRPVPAGETGDLYIGGVGLAAGYWRDADRTAAVFLHHPQRPAERIYKTGDLARIGDDGLVYFLGRSDSQIKSRGYRIELGEIEAALNAIAGIEECAVVAVGTEAFEGVSICCAYVAAPGAPLLPAAIRRELSRLVPAYMLPTRWRAFDRFPRNASGKIDRRRLKDAFEESVDAHAAQAN
jgi:amino acid adenylation domain-containing protein